MNGKFKKKSYSNRPLTTGTSRNMGKLKNTFGLSPTSRTQGSPPMHSKLTSLSINTGMLSNMSGSGKQKTKKGCDLKEQTLSVLSTIYMKKDHCLFKKHNFQHDKDLNSNLHLMSNNLSPLTKPNIPEPVQEEVRKFEHLEELRFKKAFQLALNSSSPNKHNSQPPPQNPSEKQMFAFDSTNAHIQKYEGVMGANKHNSKSNEKENEKMRGNETQKEKKKKRKLKEETKQTDYDNNLDLHFKMSESLLKQIGGIRKKITDFKVPSDSEYYPQRNDYIMDLTNRFFGERDRHFTADNNPQPEKKVHNSFKILREKEKLFTNNRKQIKDFHFRGRSEEIINGSENYLKQLSQFISKKVQYSYLPSTKK